MHRQTATTRIAATLALALGLGAAGTSHAQTWGVPTPGPHSSIDGNIVAVQIQVEGETAPLFYRPGVTDRHYFQAFQGRHYALVLRNTTGQRVGVAIAVDGLNVVDGQRTDLAFNDPMYVLDPYESATIRGWRTSTSEVRRFVFVDENRSYATRTGQANGDMGWIRVAAFREEAPRTWWPGRVRRDFGGGPSASAPVPPSADELQRAPSEPQQKSQDLRNYADNDAPHAEAAPGTGWGDRKWDPVQRTQFLAERSASDLITLRYEYASGLRALGIITRRPRVWEREQGQYGFAQPPRW